MKILVIGALSTASIYFAQTYPVSAIPENLKKNADVVIRKDFTTVLINKIDEIKYQYNTVTTVLNKDGDSKALIYIPYKKGDNISDVKVTVYDESGKKIKSFSKSDFGDFANNTQGVFYSDSRILALSYTSAYYPYTVDFSYQRTDENTIFIPDFVPFSSPNESLEESQFKIIINPMLFLSKSSNEFDQADERKYPIDFISSFTKVKKVILEIPEGYVIETMPKNKKIVTDDKEIEYSYVAEQKGNKLEVISTIKTASPDYPKEYYPAFKQIWGTASKSENQVISLVRKS